MALAEAHGVKTTALTSIEWIISKKLRKDLAAEESMLQSRELFENYNSINYLRAAGQSVFRQVEGARSRCFK